MVGDNMINVYLPNNSLQGSEIPFYLIWQGSENIDLIIIEYPDDIEIKEIYNVSEGNFRIENNILYISKVDVNGYLGIKFVSKLTKPLVKKNIQVKIYKNNQLIYNEVKSIRLFRPEVELYNIPQHISINVLESKNTIKINISDKIKVANSGEGTAVLTLKCLEESQIKKYDPMGIDEFRKKFWNDVEKKIYNLKETYPEYASLLFAFVDFGKNPPVFEKSALAKIKEVFEGLIGAFEENEAFFEEFARIILTSYLKNISIVTELESFLIYLKSVYENKIIFIDAVNVIKVSTTPMKLRTKLYITDFAYNEYKPIDLGDITLISNKEFELPLYALFDFGMINRG